MIRRQRQAIDEKIRELSNCHIVYTGIDFQKKEAGIPKKIIDVEDLPGLKGLKRLGYVSFAMICYLLGKGNAISSSDTALSTFEYWKIALAEAFPTEQSAWTKNRAINLELSSFRWRRSGQRRLNQYSEEWFGPKTERACGDPPPSPRRSSVILVRSLHCTVGECPDYSPQVHQ
ncbi:hypothetical protein RHMOL_Rhmol11G0093100 [Rhododendron molle]|uniref:Uncharacterized protein n=1 Tax=Rhododendron molle TaxID=49168 RepID=A0ACC0LR85_RHOML|nr:hypothetical protein RHMOL_Rhmol11G0093100 [Rhododendron molle]